MEPFIAGSARKHGVADEDMLHAYRNPIRVWPLDEDMTVFVGPDRAGRLLEVGVVDSDVGPAIVHAMPARPRFLPRR
jgi:hypothetical protein